MTKATSPIVTPIIRRAVQSDLSALTELMREADERPYSEGDVRWILRDLDESKFVAWIAHAEETPCGITMLQRVPLRWGHHDYRAGFWVNLYVRPSMRHTRLFPRLVMQMFREAHSLGFDLIYAATRRQQVADANLALGMSLVGRLPLYGKLLRPGRLMIKHRGWGWWSRFPLALADFIFTTSLRFHLRRIPQTTGRLDIRPDDTAIDAVLAQRDRESSSLVFTPYEATSFHERYRRGPDGGSYSIIGTLKDDRTGSVLIWRLAERGPNIRAAIVMDVIGADNDTQAMSNLFQMMHKAALDSGAELVLALPGWGPHAVDLLKSLGYLQMPEVYTVMVRPIMNLSDDFPLTNIARWRYTFADNDAF